MIHECFFLGLVAPNREFSAKILHKKTGKTAGETLTYYLRIKFGVSCGLIDNAMRGDYNYYINSCTFYRPDKVFSRVHSLIQNLSSRGQVANLNFLQVISFKTVYRQIAY